MPIIQSAIKKLRQDHAKTLRNKRLESDLKKAMSTLKKSKSADALKKAYSQIDKAAKKKIIHKKKAARLKSLGSKILSAVEQKSKK